MPHTTPHDVRNERHEPSPDGEMPTPDDVREELQRLYQENERALSERDAAALHAADSYLKELTSDFDRETEGSE